MGIFSSCLRIQASEEDPKLKLCDKKTLRKFSFYNFEHKQEYSYQNLLNSGFLSDLGQVKDFKQYPFNCIGIVFQQFDNETRIICGNGLLINQNSVLTAASLIVHPHGLWGSSPVYFAIPEGDSYRTIEAVALISQNYKKSPHARNNNYAVLKLQTFEVRTKYFEFNGMEKQDSLYTIHNCGLNCKDSQQLKRENNKFLFQMIKTEGDYDVMEKGIKIKSNLSLVGSPVYVNALKNVKSLQGIVIDVEDSIAILLMFKQKKIINQINEWKQMSYQSSKGSDNSNKSSSFPSKPRQCNVQKISQRISQNPYFRFKIRILKNGQKAFLGIFNQRQHNFWKDIIYFQNQEGKIIHGAKTVNQEKQERSDNPFIHHRISRPKGFKQSDQVQMEVDLESGQILFKVNEREIISYECQQLKIKSEIQWFPCIWTQTQDSSIEYQERNLSHLFSSYR